MDAAAAVDAFAGCGEEEEGEPSARANTHATLVGGGGNVEADVDAATVGAAGAAADAAASLPPAAVVVAAPVAAQLACI